MTHFNYFCCVLNAAYIGIGGGDIPTVFEYKRVTNPEFLGDKPVFVQVVSDGYDIFCLGSEPGQNKFPDIGRGFASAVKIGAKNLSEYGGVESRPFEFPTATPVGVIADNMQFCAVVMQRANHLHGVGVDTEHLLMFRFDCPDGFIPRKKIAKNQFGIIPTQHVMRGFSDFSGGVLFGHPAFDHNALDKFQDETALDLAMIIGDRTIDVDQKI
jgi:hypothetical protein